jgi:hypothetical protein
LGLGLAVFHACALMLLLAAKEPLPARRSRLEPCPPEAVCFDLWDAAGQSVVAGRPVHFHYETLLMKLLIIADMPAIVAAGVASLPLFWILRHDELRQSWLVAAGWVGFGSLQWWMLGTYIYMKRKLIR